MVSTKERAVRRGIAAAFTGLLFLAGGMARGVEIDFQSLRPLKATSISGPSKTWTISLQGAKLEWRRFENKKTRQSRQVTLASQPGMVLSFGERPYKTPRSDHELLEGMRQTNARVPSLHYVKALPLPNAVGKKILVYKHDSPLLDQSPYYYFGYFHSAKLLVTMVASPQPGATQSAATAKDIAAIAKTLKFIK